jgi:hypothetical protein
MSLQTCNVGEGANSNDCKEAGFSLLILYSLPFNPIHFGILRSLVSVLVFEPGWGVLVRTPPWPAPYWDIPGDYCR